MGKFYIVNHVKTRCQRINVDEILTKNYCLPHNQNAAFEQ